MMGIYIVEDDDTMIEILEDMIEEYELAEVVGATENGMPDVDEILDARPDIVLIDFLMPGKDGAELVRELRNKGCGAHFIMISQVSSKDMIAKAYDAGIEFFISKPINLIEVKSVIANVTRQIRNERAIEQLRNMFMSEVGIGAEPGVQRTALGTVSAASEMNAEKAEEERRQEFERSVNRILSRLGMSGEKGGADIVAICLYLYDRGRSMSRESIGQICGALSDAPKSMEQRVRRAIAVGLTNIAHLGIEDFMNETFSEYSNTLFPFEEVRAEMDYIRGKNAYGGKTSIKKFIESLMFRAEHEL